MRRAGMEGCQSVPLTEAAWPCPEPCPLSLENTGGRSVADCLGTMGPSPVGCAAGPLTIGLGQPLSCCPRPETDAQEPPVSAPEVTSGAALSLRAGAPEREGGKQWGPHAGRPASGTGRGLPREGTACQVLLLSPGTGAFHRGLPAQRQERSGAGGPLVVLRGGPTELILLALFCPGSPAPPCTWPLTMSFRKAVHVDWPQTAPGLCTSDFMTTSALGNARLRRAVPP